MEGLIPILFGLIVIVVVLKLFKGVIKFIIATAVVIGIVVFLANNNGVDLRAEFEDATGVQPEVVSDLMDAQKSDWDQAYSELMRGESNE